MHKCRNRGSGSARMWPWLTSRPSLALDPDATQNNSKAEVFPDLGGNAWEALTEIKFASSESVFFLFLLFCF